MKPKFEIGDLVTCPPDLYKCTQGQIVERERIFQELYPDGTFDPTGLSTLESTFSSFCVPWRVEGDLLYVTMPASDIKLSNGGRYTQPECVELSRFKGWAYTVESDKMRSVFSEKSLKSIK